MGEKFHDFSADEIRRMMHTQEARELAEILKQMDAAALSKAASLAGSGDAGQATAMLQPFLNDPRVQELLRKMGKADG